MNKQFELVIRSQSRSRRRENPNDLNKVIRHKNTEFFFLSGYLAEGNLEQRPLAK